MSVSRLDVRACVTDARTDARANTDGLSGVRTLGQTEGRTAAVSLGQADWDGRTHGTHGRTYTRMNGLLFRGSVGRLSDSQTDARCGQQT